MTMDKVKSALRTVPDFPKPGVNFIDITPVLEDPALFRAVLDEMVSRARVQRIGKVLAIESRGFIFGAPLAAAIGAGFVPLRKPGKLPYKTLSETYELEYGNETLEIHADAIRPGERVLIVDDVLATGGTASASVRLARTCGGEVVELLFMIELNFLHGRNRLDATPVHALISLD